MVKKSKSRKTKIYKAVKYSNETSVSSFSFWCDYSNGQPTGKHVLDNIVLLIPATSIQGMRKAKNFTLRMTTNAVNPMLFALVYVPEGTHPSKITVDSGPADTPFSHITSSDLYNPNQNVIMSGEIVANMQNNFKTRLARNLNSADSVCLVIKSQFPETVDPEVNRVEYKINIILNYAITFN